RAQPHTLPISLAPASMTAAVPAIPMPASRVNICIDSSAAMEVPRVEMDATRTTRGERGARGRGAPALDRESTSPGCGVLEWRGNVMAYKGAVISRCALAYTMVVHRYPTSLTTWVLIVQQMVLANQPNRVSKVMAERAEEL